MAPTGTIVAQQSLSIGRQKDIWKQKKNAMAQLRRQNERDANVPGCSTENSEVEILLSNLPPNVLVSDLQAHFEEFEVRHVLLNFDENGQPTGTCTILLPKFQAIQLLQKHDGSVIEGNRIQINLLNTFKTVNRRLFTEPPTEQGNNINGRYQGTLKKPELGMTNKFARKLNKGVISQEVLEASFNNITL